VWSLIRSESTAVYQKILGDLKAACNSLLPEGSSFAPSCILVDNSDAEISAARCAMSKYSIVLNGNRATCCSCGTSWTSMQIGHVYSARCLNCTNNDHMCSHVTFCEVGGAKGVIWAVGVIDNDQEAAARQHPLFWIHFSIPFSRIHAHSG
jgi:hypothetical protein